MKIKSLLLFSNGLMVALIAALVFLGYLAVYQKTIPAIESSSDDATTINLAGRQRMLTQKLSKELELAFSGKVEAVAQAQSTIAEFDSVLAGLIQGDRDRGLAPPPSSEIASELEKTRSLWASFEPQARVLLESVAGLGSAMAALDSSGSDFAANAAQLRRSVPADSALQASLAGLEAAYLALDQACKVIEGGGTRSEQLEQLDALVGETRSLLVAVGEAEVALGSEEQLEKVLSSGALRIGHFEAVATLLASRNEAVAYARANNIALLKQMNAAVGAWTALSTGRVEAMLVDTQRNFALQAGLGGISLVLGTFLGLYCFRRINGPINELVGSIGRLAEGDFREEVRILNDDELGTVAKEVNMMIGKWRATISGIVETASSLSSSSEELAAISQELETGSEHVETQSGIVATAGSQLSSSLSSMSASAGAVDAASGAIAAAVEELNASISEVARSCVDETRIASEAATKTEEAKKLMDELGQCAESVDQVVDMVSRISGHTNLLALNATIEAASAGEAGKGFAVVAAEVKKLAKEAADSNGTISKQMKRIQEFARRSLDSIDTVNTTIGEVNVISQTIAAAIEEQTATTREISRSLNDSSNRVKEVSENVTESSAGAHEVSNGISQVSEAAQHAALAARQTRGSSAELSKMAMNLSEAVGQFRI